MLRRTKLKRIRDLEEKTKQLSDALVYTQGIVHAKLTEMADKKYEFGEILECIDDIMQKLDLNH